MSNKFFQRYAEWGFPQEEVKLPQSIRINTLRISPDELEERMQLKRIPFLEHGYFLEGDVRASVTSEYLLGYYYIQEIASQLPVQVLAPEPGMTVIDMAAAPGGKTTQLAQYMQNSGTIIALDSVHTRIRALKNNIERLGIQNVIVVHKDALYAEDLNIQADAILLDAPCSGNFAADADWLEKRSMADFAQMAKLQRDLLDVAWHCLKKGGRLLYSTCSLEKEEDEDVVEWALENLPGARLLPVDGPGSPGLTEGTKHCMRMWPAQHGTQGFFMALMQKI